MGYELNRLMKQYGVATPTMAGYLGTAAPVAPTAPAEGGAQADIDKYNKDKAAFDEQLRKYTLDRKSYDQYAKAYQDRLAGTNMYNQAQFSTTGANVPAITTFSPAQKYATGVLPAVEKPVGAQQFAGVDQTGLNRRIQEYMANTKPSQTQLEEAKKIYGVTDYDIRNAMGTGAQYGTPQWTDTVQGPYYGVAPLSLAGKSAQDQANFYLSQRDLGYTDADIRAGANKTFGTLSNADWAALLNKAYPGSNFTSESPSITGVTTPPSNITTPPGSTTTPPDTPDIDFTNPVYPGGRSDWDTYVLPYAHGGEVHNLAQKYAVGGAVKTHYQTGGLKDEGIVDPVTGVITYPVREQPQITSRSLEPSPLSAVAETAPAQSLPQLPADSVETPPPPPAAAAPALDARTAGLQSLLERYGPQEGGYAQEVAAARQRAQAETTAFTTMLERMMNSPEDERSSKAEMYFRLAAAFGSPSKTGQFTENLAMAGQQLGEYAKGQRETSAKKRDLMLEVQKMKMGAAKDDLAAVRDLEAEAMRDRRAIAQELIKEYIASGKPQSDAGKQAMDMGLRPGTPEYQAKVQELAEFNVQRQMAGINNQLAQLTLSQANLALRQQTAARLSPTELNMLKEGEDLVSSGQQALADLSEAYRLNPNSLAGGWIERGQQFLFEAAGSNDPTIVNTRVINNLLGAQGLAKLRATFGGNPTEGERAILLELEGIGSKTREERASIMRRAYRVLQDRVAREQRRIDDLRSGAYRMIEPLPTGEQ